MIDFADDGIVDDNDVDCSDNDDTSDDSGNNDFSTCGDEVISTEFDGDNSVCDVVNGNSDCVDNSLWFF